MFLGSPAYIFFFLFVSFLFSKIIILHEVKNLKYLTNSSSQVFQRTALSVLEQQIA